MDALHGVLCGPSLTLCAGFGGLSQGAVAAGFEVAVACDHNPKMLEMYPKASDALTVCGDFRIGQDSL